MTPRNTPTRRHDAPFSANEAYPSPGCCAWVRGSEARDLILRIWSWFPDSPLRDEVRVVLTEFCDALMGFGVCRMEFLAAAPAKDVRFVCGADIPQRYEMMLAAVRAGNAESFLGHCESLAVDGVATATVGGVGPGVESGPMLEGGRA
jgi:hypothetical protein